MIRLLDLPPELLIHSFAYLPFKSIVSLSSTSKFTKELVSTSVLLQYLIWLGSSSLCHAPTRASSLVHSLDVLRQGEEGWSEWKAQKAACLEIQHRQSGIYDLTCGILILGEAGYERRTQALHWADLRKGKDMIWNRLDLQEDIVDLALNVHEWDLIAIVTSSPAFNNILIIQVHLLQLSTSKGSDIRYHPLASQPTLPILSYHAGHGRCSLAMEIVGIHLALLLTFPHSIHPTDKLYIFNWKTGKLLFTREAERLTYNTLTFLSEDVLLLQNLAENTLELCSFSRSPNISAQIEEQFPDVCLQINQDFASAIPLHTAATLTLPSLAPHVELAMSGCRGEPTPYSTAHEPTPVEGGTLFRPRSDSAIVIFNMTIESDTRLRFGPLTFVSFVIHRQALLDQLDPKDQGPPVSALSYLEDTDLPSMSPSFHSDADPRHVVPWTEWGPPLTRWFPTNGVSTRWITTTCGQRWVTVAGDQPSAIVIRDFNPVNIKRVIAKLGETRSYETDDAVIRVVDSPSYMSNDFGNTFEESVESRLPYVETETKEKFMYTSVLMSENWLLGVLLEQTDASMNRMDIFSML